MDWTQIALFILAEAIKEEPKLAAELQTLFKAGDPASAEWQAQHDRIANQDYLAYVPESSLAGQVATPVPVRVLPPPGVPDPQPAAAIPAAAPAAPTAEPAKEAMASAAPLGIQPSQADE